MTVCRAFPQPPTTTAWGQPIHLAGEAVLRRWRPAPDESAGGGGDGESVLLLLLARRVIVAILWFRSPRRRRRRRRWNRRQRPPHTCVRSGGRWYGVAVAIAGGGGDGGGGCVGGEGRCRHREDEVALDLHGDLGHHCHWRQPPLRVHKRQPYPLPRATAAPVFTPARCPWSLFPRVDQAIAQHPTSLLLLAA
jgi:hypothetical protein